MSKWDLQLVQLYITNQVEENLNLDYKAADALQKTDGKKKEITKDVSAMANAAGGIIVYGIKEFNDSTKQHLPEKIDPVNRTEISKEWLEQVISNIQPRIQGIIITPVTVDQTNNGVIYVVQIPQSTTAHQATDKRYYKRYNFESIPMEDYEIRDIMSRTKHPEVTLEFVLEGRQEKEKDPITGGPPVSFFPTMHYKQPATWIRYTLKVAMRNSGKIFANYVNYYLELPRDILFEEGKDFDDSLDKPGYKKYYGENTIRDVVDIKPMIGTVIEKYGPSRFDPILPGMRSRFDKIRLVNNNNKWDKQLFWIIYADNAEPQMGSINLSSLIPNIIDVDD
jgi:hypothetical protein